MTFGACGGSNGGSNGSNQLQIDGQIVSSAKATTTKNVDTTPVSGTVTCTITASDASGTVFFTSTASVQLDFAPGSVTPIDGQNFSVATVTLPDNESVKSGFSLDVECQKDGANFLQAIVANYSGDVTLSISDNFHVTVTLSNFFDFATSDETIAFFESFSCFSLKILEPLTTSLCSSSTTTTTADSQPTSQPSLTFCETIALGITAAEEVVCGPSSGGDCGPTQACNTTTPCPTGFTCVDPGCCKASSTCETAACDETTPCKGGFSCVSGCCQANEIQDFCDSNACADVGGSCQNENNIKLCLNPTSLSCPQVGTDGPSIYCGTPASQGACAAAVSLGAPANSCDGTCCELDAPVPPECSVCDPVCGDGFVCAVLRDNSCGCVLGKPTKPPDCTLRDACVSEANPKGCALGDLCTLDSKSNSCVCEANKTIDCTDACLTPCDSGMSCQQDTLNGGCSCQPAVLPAPVPPGP